MIHGHIHDSWKGWIGEALTMYYNVSIPAKIEYSCSLFNIIVSNM